MQVYKIMYRLTDLNPEDFFTCSTSGLRDHRYKLFKHRVTTDVGKFFSFRVMNMQNSLPDEVVDVGTVNSCKNKIDNIIKFGWGLK